jgi:hypothetical protein
LLATVIYRTHTVITTVLLSHAACHHANTGHGWLRLIAAIGWLRHITIGRAVTLFGYGCHTLLPSLLACFVNALRRRLVLYGRLAIIITAEAAGRALVYLFLIGLVTHIYYALLLLYCCCCHITYGVTHGHLRPLLLAFVIYYGRLTTAITGHCLYSLRITHYFITLLPLLITYYFYWLIVLLFIGHLLAIITFITYYLLLITSFITSYCLLLILLITITYYYDITLLLIGLLAYWLISYYLLLLLLLLHYYYYYYYYYYY